MRLDLQEGDAGHEGCDDGNEVDSDACTNACRSLVAAMALFAKTSTKEPRLREEDINGIDDDDAPTPALSMLVVMDVDVGEAW